MFQPGFENVWELPFSFRVDEYDRSLREVDQRYGRDAAGEDERVRNCLPRHYNISGGRIPLLD
jgi:hypothetical protein